MSPVVKICGLRRLEDARLALELGAGFLGCVVAKDSPRCATRDEVAAIVAAARGRAEVVLVFRRANANEILDTCEATGVRRVQIHGTNPMACRMLRFHGIRMHPVFRVREGAARLPELDPRPTEQAPAVLDAGLGGQGVRFAWELLRDGVPPATLIAGGITPDNAAELLAFHPFGIDLSSGIEVEPGVKDAQGMRTLFAAVAASVRGIAS